MEKGVLQMVINKVDYVENLLFKTYACKRSLEAYPENFVGTNYDVAVERYCSLLKEKIENPIVTKLVATEMAENTPIEKVKNFSINTKKLENNPKIQNLLKKVTALEAQYPKTLAVRERLIEEKRIKLFGVVPKLNGFKKFMLKLKLMF